MDLQSLTKQLDDLTQSPPFDKWHPPFCGDIDMVIKADGRWFYMGSPIGREKLVSLFASVLIVEDDEYYLKTPAEKVRIQVEDAPFVITQWHYTDTQEGPVIVVTNNLNQSVVLGPDHPLINKTHSSPDAEPELYVKLHRNLTARVHRNVFYQWLEQAESTENGLKDDFFILSGGNKFLLGSA